MLLMQPDVLKKRPLSYGSFDGISGETGSHSAKWKLWRKAGDSIWLLYASKNGQASIAPMIKHSFYVPHSRTSAAMRTFFQRYYAKEEKTLGMQLRYYRYQAGYQQKEMAEILGIDRTTYSEYERDKYPCPMDRLGKALDLLKVEPDRILDEYQCFLYKGQGQGIKLLRQKAKMRQWQLAQTLQVDCKEVESGADTNIKGKL